MLATVMIFSLGTFTYADASSNDKDKNLFDILEKSGVNVPTRQVEKEITYTITDPKVIAKLSNSEKLPDKIEITYIPAEKIYAEIFKANPKVALNLYDKLWCINWSKPDNHVDYQPNAVFIKKKIKK